MMIFFFRLNSNFATIIWWFYGYESDMVYILFCWTKICMVFVNWWSLMHSIFCNKKNWDLHKIPHSFFSSLLDNSSILLGSFLILVDGKLWEKRRRKYLVLGILMLFKIWVNHFLKFALNLIRWSILLNFRCLSISCLVSMEVQEGKGIKE